MKQTTTNAVSTPATTIKVDEEFKVGTVYEDFTCGKGYTSYKVTARTAKFVTVTNLTDGTEKRCKIDFEQKKYYANGYHTVEFISPDKKANGFSASDIDRKAMQQIKAALVEDIANEYAVSPEAQGSAIEAEIEQAASTVAEIEISEEPEQAADAPVDDELKAANQKNAAEFAQALQEVLDAEKVAELKAEHDAINAILNRGNICEQTASRLREMRDDLSKQLGIEPETPAESEPEITPVDAAIESLDDEMKDEVRANIEPYKAEYEAAIAGIYLDDLTNGDDEPKIIPAADLLQFVIPLALTDHSSTAYRKNPDGSFSEDTAAFARLLEVENKIFHAADYEIGIEPETKQAAETVAEVEISEEPEQAADAPEIANAAQIAAIENEISDARLAELLNAYEQARSNALHAAFDSEESEILNAATKAVDEFIIKAAKKLRNFAPAGYTVLDSWTISNGDTPKFVILEYATDKRTSYDSIAAVKKVFGDVAPAILSPSGTVTIEVANEPTTPAEDEEIIIIAQNGGKLTIEGGMPLIGANGNKLEIDGITVGEYYTHGDAQEAAEALITDIEEFGNDHPVLNKEYFAEIEFEDSPTGGNRTAEHLNATAPEGWTVTRADDKLRVNFNGEFVAEVDHVTNRDLLVPQAFFDQFIPLVDETKTPAQMFIDARYRELAELEEMRKSPDCTPAAVQTLDEMIDRLKRDIADAELSPVDTIESYCKAGAVDEHGGIWF